MQDDWGAGHARFYTSIGWPGLEKFAVRGDMHSIINLFLRETRIRGTAYISMYLISLFTVIMVYGRIEHYEMRLDFRRVFNSTEVHALMFVTPPRFCHQPNHSAHTKQSLLAWAV
jgi:hypothetical protein